MRYLYLLAFLFFCYSVQSQVVFWSENFNNGCTDNCGATAYSSANGNWTVTDVGTNGNFANEWFVSCAENGEAVGQCGAGCGSNSTLHIGSIPCTLCFFCPNGDCGAAYNAGPTFSGEDPTTSRRAESPLINTTGKTNITLSFKYIERGQAALDDASVYYSTDGGTNWTLLTNTAKTANTCGASQGLWTAFTNALPVSCENITTLKIGILWVNDDDGSGSDPSFALDDMELSTPAAGSAPVAAFTVNSNFSCDSLCATFTDISTGSPTQWLWSFPGASPSSSNVQNPSNICYTAPGTYSVTLTAINAFGNDTSVQTNLITIEQSPMAFFNTTITTICEGDCIIFQDASSADVISWSWTFNGGTPATATGQNAGSVCFNTSGIYTISLTVNDGQCFNSMSRISYITVNECNLPSAQFSVDDSTVCFGDCTNFTDLSVNATSWNWSFPGAIPNTSNTQNPSFVCYLAPGQYDVQLIVGNGTTSDTLVLTNYVEVFAVNNPTVTANGYVLTSTAAVSYQWYSSQTGIISGATSQSYTATVTGDYFVSATDSNGCITQSNLVHIDVTSIVELIENGIHIYPLPFSDVINIKSEKIMKRIFFTDAVGRVIQSVDVNGKEYSLPSNVSNGIYFLRIETDKDVFTAKVISQR